MGAIKTFSRVEAQLQSFLTSVLDGYEQSASHPDRFMPGERAPVAH